MSDFDGQESTQTEYAEPTVSDVTLSEEDHSPNEQPSNPHWGEVEKLVGPNVYQLIQPHLAKADTQARERVERVNQSFAPFKQFADAGITPEQIAQSINVVRQLNDPEQQVQVYESLQRFLQQNGRLPNKQELQEQVEDDVEASEAPEDPRLAAVMQQNQAIMEHLQQQYIQAQNAEASREADSWIESERTRLKSKGYDDADVKEIVRIAAASIGASNRAPENLDAAAAHFDALRDRLRATPRPGTTAPRLPSGPGGGTPGGGSVNPDKLTKEQRIELALARLQQGQ